jgi:hypothetical protein
MTFTPSGSLISGITQAIPAVITTSTPHGLFNGGVARLIVPKNYGMFPLSGLAVQVIVLSPTTFSCYASLVPTAVPVNSTNFPAFVVPTNPGLLAQVLPMGQGSTPKNDVPWQTTNGLCTTPLDDAVLNNSTVEIPF